MAFRTPAASLGGTDPRRWAFAVVRSPPNRPISADIHSTPVILDKQRKGFASMVMMTPFRLNRLGKWLGAIVAASALSVAGPASASDRWEEAGSGAVAILPPAMEASTITGGSLVCAQKRWSLRLRVDERVPGTHGAIAKVTIDGESFPLTAEHTGGAVTLPVTREMLDGLKAGGRLVIDFGPEESDAGATFALRSSRAVIEAIAPRCSEVDMAGYDRITLSDTDPAVETAEPLLAEELKLFRAATSSKPQISATRLDRGAGRELIFSNLCGSSWYYGRTGCSLFGFVRTSPTAEWAQVYNTEGMSLYIDPNASKDGWPDLVTLEPDGYEPAHWQWNGSAYAPVDPKFAADELRGSTDTR
jgi:hypothetical protein